MSIVNMNQESKDIILQLPEDVQKLCRTCLSIPNSGILSEEIQIFDEHNNLSDVAHMLQFCSSVKINPMEGLPIKICEDCATKLQIAYDFIQQCERSDLSLRKIMNISPPERDENFFRKNMASNTIDNSFTVYENIPEKRAPPEFNQIDLSNIFEQNQLFIEKYVGYKNLEVPIHNDKKIKDDFIFLIKNRKSFESNVFQENLLSNDIKNETFEEIEFQKNFVCPFCTKILFDQQLYMQHCANCTKICNLESADTPANLKSFDCCKCDKKFKTKYEFRSHMSLHLKKKSKINNFYICDLCNKPFKNASKLALHFYNHAKMVNKEKENSISLENESLKCYLCTETFETANDLKDHIKHHAKANCKICSEEFSDEQSLVNHLKKHGIQIAYCQICSKKFESISKLRFHQKIHVAEKSRSVFFCPICKKDFKSAELLQEHSVQHLNQIYKCDKCRRTFNNIVSYEFHLKQHLEPKYLCSVCGKQYFSNITLACHVRAHTNEKPYACSLCHKSFTSRSTLSVHKRIHSMFKPYVCSYCGYSCRQSGDLAMHIRTHTGDKPYKCTFPNCDRKFTTSSQRSEHYRRHTNERNHKCQDCGKAFLESKTLKVHMLIHTGEKPHSCEVCGKKFRRSHHLVNHVKAHASVSVETACNV